MSRPNPFAWNQGRHLALTLLEQSTGRSDIASSDLGDGRESNPVMDYVEKAINTDDRTVLRAFCAVLSDFVAAAASRGEDGSSSPGMARKT